MTQPARPTHWWHAVDRRTFNKGAVAFTALLSMSGCKSEEEQGRRFAQAATGTGLERWRQRKPPVLYEHHGTGRERLDGVAGLYGPDASDCCLAAAHRGLAEVLYANVDAGVER